MIIVLVGLIIIICMLFFLKRKNLINIKLNVKKILLICIFIIICIIVIIKRHEIVFSIQSLKYKYIDNYDYRNDIYEMGHISKNGAIKIAKEKTNSERIANVTCELAEDSTYWSIVLTTGWDYMCGHPTKWYFEIDYYTGKILIWTVTD